MRVVIINKSDSTGGTAIVSRRLMEALRAEGIDARMLVAERLTDSPYISTIASPARIRWAFIADRLRIAFANGFSRRTLFQADAAAAGIDLSRHPLVKQADAVIINWINQGVLSLKGIERIAATGKKILWTMHDMWNFTGICHHAGECRRYIRHNGVEEDDNHLGTSGSPATQIPCGDCPLLGKHAHAHDLSYTTAARKLKLYHRSGIRFIAVSNWLARRATESVLLGRENVMVIPNAFPMPEDLSTVKPTDSNELRLIFGSARLDDPIKDFPLLIESLNILKEIDPALASRTVITLFGSIRDASLIDRIPVKCDYRGMLHSQKEIADLYRKADIVISTSSYETLPGTLIEGQAYGCWPIAIDSGGQSDIITDGVTGRLLNLHDMLTERKAGSGAPCSATLSNTPDMLQAKGRMFAEAIIESAALLQSDPLIPDRLRQSIVDKFSAPAIARRYIALLNTES